MWFLVPLVLSKFKSAYEQNYYCESGTRSNHASTKGNCKIYFGLFESLLGHKDQIW
jgi:hypothetical protein